MARFIVRRLIGMVLVLFAVSVLTFLIFQVIPNSDPAVRMAGKTPTESQVAQIRKTWHFDDSLPEQYWYTMKQIFSGNLVSYSDQTNVTHQIWIGLPRTFALGIGAAIIWMALGIALGLFSAVRAGKAWDRILTILALIGVSMPVFWVGALMTYYLGYKAGLFPNGGYSEIGQDGVGQWI